MSKSISPLWLDYQRTSPRRQLPGLLLLVFSLLLFGWLLNLSFALSEQSASAEQRLARLRQDVERQRQSAAPVDAPAGEVSEGSPPAIEAGRWDALLNLLETAGDDSVTLLGLAPGAKEITINGEARDVDAVLDYALRLQSAPVLARAHVAKYDVVADHPRRPIRFTVLAEWREGGS